MNTLLNFLETLDENIYVADMDTYELLYLNARLRKSLGLSRPEEYQGKKCYELLRGCQEPCQFCQAEMPEEGECRKAIHENPVLHRKFIVESVPLPYEGRRLVLRLAVDQDLSSTPESHYYYARGESIMKECLQRLFATSDPEASLELMLDYIGDIFQCDRVSIFELQPEGSVKNSYEWCRQGVLPQKGLLQKLSRSDVEYLLKRFQKEDSIVIEDLEELRSREPECYSLFKPQRLHALAGAGLWDEGKLRGFWIVGNADEAAMPLVRTSLKMLGYFMATQLKRRELYRRLNELSYRDMLTGAYNRNALYAHSPGYQKMRSLGVIFTDITGLKQVNDSMGHAEGDKTIRSCYQLMRKTLSTQWIYRAGGDEFVAIYPNIGPEQLQEEENKLRRQVLLSSQHMAMGQAWSDKRPLNVEALLGESDDKMYEDKREFYTNSWIASGVDRRRVDKVLLPQERSSALSRFMDASYYDLDSFLGAMAEDNHSSYFYFGDVQKDVFYISDNMREKFGFENNVVPGFLKLWAKHIPSQQDRDRYREDLRRMVEEKRRAHDLRYQVTDAAGQSIWVHSHACLQWDAQQETPIFFSGRIVHQDEQFLVDPLTGFPKSTVFQQELACMEREDAPQMAIGFCLNNIYEINTTRGRESCDRLIQDISHQLMERMSERLFFYRLDGMRCVALPAKSCEESPENLVEEIREIVRENYHALGVTVHQPCSFAVMEYSPKRNTPLNFVTDMVALIRVARQEGSCSYVDDSDGNLRRIEESSRLALELSRNVLEDMENFRIVVQPLVSAETGQIIGGETLLRWTYQGKEISPVVFIPILEKENMIQAVGRWVFDQAARACTRILSYAPEFSLTVNVSRRQLSDEGFPAFMEDTLRKYQLDGRHIVAELTESCMDGQQEKLNRFLKKCQDCGIRIALDDFGSGYSSLRVLLQCPSSIIKLDRSLLLEMGGSPEKQSFVSSIVYACHRYGKKVCMEGVETDRQNVMAIESSCDIIQGFYHYKPMELEQVLGVLSTKTEKENEDAKLPRMS